MKTSKKQSNMEAAIIGCIPSNWCDPLLTGPDASMRPGEKCTCQQVEALLNGIRIRVATALVKYRPKHSKKAGRKLK